MFKDLYLETERLMLRALVMDDLAAFHRILSRPEMLKYLPEEPMSLEECEDILKWLITCYAQNTPQHMIKFTNAVVKKDTQQLIGWCGLGPLDFDESKIELYYGIAQEYWGHGYATEAAQAMLQYGFHTIELEEIVAVVAPKNVASVRVLEKIGMQYQKSVRNLPSEFSAYENDCYYALTQAEYQT